MGPIIEGKQDFLFISDLQMPFEHPNALKFLTYLKRHYKIPDENCYCLGDETDQYWGSLWKKDPNAYHTATQEISETIDRLRPWYDVFPELRIAISNHGTRWQRKALEAEIPELLFRRYESVLGCPDKWMWQKRWLIKSRTKIAIEHGDRFGGQYPHVQAAMTNACSTVIGHHHSIAGIEYIKTEGAQDDCETDYGMNVVGVCGGSLIDFEKYAFHYARTAKRKPCIGTPIAFNGGKQWLWIPLE